MELSEISGNTIINEKTYNDNLKGDDIIKTYNHLLNYINIIENVTHIISHNTETQSLTNIIKTSCNKMKQSINYNIDSNNIDTTVFNMYEKIQQIITSNKLIINNKNIKINEKNELDSSIMINNNEILIERLFYNVIQNILCNMPDDATLNILIKHNYPYILISLMYKDIYTDLDEKYIEHIIGKLNGVFSKDTGDMIQLNFNIPLHSKIINNLSNTFK